MVILNIVFLILGIIDIVQGIGAIRTGKVSSYGFSNKIYTDESLKEASHSLGNSSLISGTGMILCALLDSGLFKGSVVFVTAGFAILVIMFIISFVIFFKAKKLLVKK